MVFMDKKFIYDKEFDRLEAHGVVSEYIGFKHHEDESLVVPGITLEWVLDNMCVRGDKVKFLGRNGYDSELEYALSLFEVGDLLEVERVNVGGSKSSYKFVGMEQDFNTVMFLPVRHFDLVDMMEHNA